VSACVSSSFRAVLVVMLDIDARDLILEFWSLRADVRYAATQLHSDVAASHSEFFCRFAPSRPPKALPA
jgi:hypothetical protein